MTRLYVVAFEGKPRMDQRDEKPRARIPPVDDRSASRPGRPFRFRRTSQRSRIHGRETFGFLRPGLLGEFLSSSIPSLGPEILEGSSGGFGHWTLAGFSVLAAAAGMLAGAVAYFRGPGESRFRKDGRRASPGGVGEMVPGRDIRGGLLRSLQAVFGTLFGFRPLGGGRRRRRPGNPGRESLGPPGSPSDRPFFATTRRRWWEALSPWPRSSFFFVWRVSDAELRGGGFARKNGRGLGMSRPPVLTLSRQW